MARPFAHFLRRLAPPDELTVCARCGSDFVSPTDWTARDETTWWIRLRCGECGAAREVVVLDETAKRYDVALGCGMDAIAATLRRLDR